MLSNFSLFAPLLSTENGTFYTNRCVKENPIMKESRQINRQIRVQEDKKSENTNAKSPLTFRHFLSVVAYMQIHKTQRKLERHFLYAKV